MKQGTGIRSTATAMAAALMLGAAAGSAQAAWHDTASHALPLPEGAHLLGAPDAQQIVHLGIALRLPDRAGLEHWLARTRTPGDREFGAILGAEEFASRYAPTAREAQTVADYLRRSGFTTVSIEPNRLLIRAEGPVAAAEAAFGTQLRRIQLADGRLAFLNTAPVRVPESLADTVLAVAGLDDLGHFHTQLRELGKPAPQDPTTGWQGFDPLQLRHLYGGDGTPDGSGFAAGIIAIGDLKSTIADLEQFEAAHNITPVPVDVVHTGLPIPEPVGSVEWNLDSQAVVSMAGALKHLTFYSAQTDLNEDFEMAVNRVITDDQVQAINVSLGICEGLEAWTGAMQAFDQLFMEAAAQGQTFFVASGDNGARFTCPFRIGLGLHVEYPASSPWVVAVGGTTLTADSSGNYLAESAWNGAGGGFSEYEAAPAWQTAVTGNSMRGVPDIAMDANPYTGAIIVASGQNEQVGGTSLAAPLSVGAFMRLWSGIGTTPGFFAPWIYPAGSAYRSAAHDITSGANGLGGYYKAGPGWDGVTGFGSFDIAAMIAAGR